LLEGGNGTGKTSILEALHYGCFLKSFRTNKSKELVSFDKQHFFLNVDFQESAGDYNKVQVGVSFENGKQKKLVRFNQKVIKSYRDLVSRYRIISLAEEDLQLVQGAPEHRRNFLTQILVLFEPDSTILLKKYKQVLEHRNKLLMNMLQNIIAPHSLQNASDELKIWTKQLWELSRQIQKKRIYYLKKLESVISELTDNQITFSYTVKNDIDEKNLDLFLKRYNEKIIYEEKRWGRSLFGVHLDDFSIDFQKTRARHYASRGQQKLVVFLVKISLAKELEKMGQQATLLLDDFLTDFDENRLYDCLELIKSLSCQVFLTCPVKRLILKNIKKDQNLFQIITLNS
jgi:DNA replication and repair protein RecF